MTPLKRKNIPGFPGYKIDTVGRIWGRKKSHMKCSISGSGYPHITLRHNGKPACRFVHRLMAAAFIGPCPRGKQCAHLDNDKTNFNLNNLVYKTPKENNADKIRHGTHQNGSKIRTSKLTRQSVVYIRKSDLSTKELAKKFGVHTTTINYVQSRRNYWTHVK